MIVTLTWSLRRLRHFMMLVLLATASGAVTQGIGSSARAAEAPLPSDLTARIEEGEAAFRIQNYEKVVEALDRLAGHPLLEGRSEHLRVLEMLAASHWFLGARDSARLVFGQLLRESPFHKLDAFVYPPELLSFFDTRKRELVQAGIIPANPGPDGGATRRVLVREVSADATPTIAYFAPFGIGQFANGEDGKGTGLAIIQGVGMATMAATWVGIETLKIGDTNRIAESDRGQARLLEALWYGGMVVTVASWTYGIIDGFVNRDTRPRVEERWELLEPGRTTPVTQAPTVRLVPGPGDLGGVGLDVSF